MSPTLPETRDSSRRAPWLDLRIGICSCLLSNALVLGAAWYGANYLPRADGEPGHRTLLQAMLMWDGGWYWAITQRGYYYQLHRMSNVVFFPLYPLAALDVAMLTGISIDAALVVVSNVCFAAALVLLSIYCRGRWPDAPERLRWCMVLVCALFPAGCFFHMAYTESCFLLLSVAAFLGLERRWPPCVTAGVIGLATAARPTGVALLAPLAIQLWCQHRSLRARLLALTIWLPLGCWGLLAFMAHQHAMFGNALAFADSQRSWHIQPLVRPEKKAMALISLEPLRAVYNAKSPACWQRFDRHWPLSWQFANPIFFVTACGLVAVGLRSRWLSAGEASFSVLLLLIPYVTRGYEMGMGSMGRFVSVAFPIYLVIGHLLDSRRSRIIAIVLTGMGVYLAVFSTRFAAGYFVF